MMNRKEKRAAEAPGSSKERKNKSQRSQYDSTAPVPEGFVAGRPIPKSKHHTYFEIVENHAKKKKLESQVEFISLPSVKRFETILTGFSGHLQEGATPRI